MVGLYQSITRQSVLQALKKTLNERENKFISTDGSVKMAEFVLKNNSFQFNGKVIQQFSGTAIGTKFAPTYACAFMDQEKLIFSILWFCYTEDVLFVWTRGENELKSFMEKLDQFHPNLTFTYESSKREFAFLDCKVNLFDNKLTTDLYVNPKIRISTWITTPH